MEPDPTTFHEPMIHTAPSEHMPYSRPTPLLRPSGHPTAFPTPELPELRRPAERSDLIRENTAREYATMLNGANSSYRGDETTNIQNFIYFLQAHAAVGECAMPHTVSIDNTAPISGNATDGSSQAIKEISQGISLHYKILLERTKDMRVILKPSYDEIKIQKLRFEGVNSVLVEVMRTAPETIDRHFWTAFLDSCLPQVIEKLETLSSSLSNLRKRLAECTSGLQMQSHRSTDMQESTKSALTRAKDPFVQELKLLDRQLDRLEVLAKPIIGMRQEKKSSAPAANAVELEKLSVEGQASSRLYHCLGQCCPVDHEHKAIMSLRSQILDENSLDDIIPHSMRTECHMAIESFTGNKASLIWLRFVSWETGALEYKLGQTRMPNPTGGEAATMSKKRPRSTSPELIHEGPMLKAAKFYEGQPAARRASDSASETSSGWYAVREIKVCPACLAPHNDTGGKPVMQISHGDDTTFDLQIFYLPVKERPPEGFTRMSLSEVLSAFDDCKKRKQASTRKKWTARVARQVAESVLRFDWRDARRGPNTENLIFFYDKSSSKFEPFGPFLEIEIDRRRQSAAAGQMPPTTLSVKGILLDLGHILLELGSPQRFGVWSQSWDHQKHVEYLERGCRWGVATNAGMGMEYAQVIRNCAYFEVPKAKENPNIADEESFQRGYFGTIVSMLKKLEKNYPDDVLLGQ